MVIADYDGWLVPPSTPLEALTEGMATLGRLAEQHGRDMPEVTAFVTGSDRPSIERLSELGVHRALLRIPAGTREQVMPAIDDFALTIHMRPSA